MGGVVQLAGKALGGGDKKPAAPAAEEVKKTATAGETQAAMQKQASLRARRGMGGLVGRMFGSTEDKLGG
jgi:hypothetical protein